MKCLRWGSFICYINWTYDACLRFMRVCICGLHFRMTYCINALLHNMYVPHVLMMFNAQFRQKVYVELELWFCENKYIWIYTAKWLQLVQLRFFGETVLVCSLNGNAEKMEWNAKILLYPSLRLINIVI